MVEHLCFPDLTPKEREASKVLRAEIRRRRDEGENNLVIKNYKIVSLAASTATQHVKPARE